MMKTIILLVIVGLVVYGIYDEGVRDKAEKKLEDIKEKAGKYNPWQEGNNTTKKKVTYGIAQLQFVDSQGNSYQENDLKIRIPELDFNGYTDDRGEIKLYNVTSHRAYTLNITEGYGSALVYPLEKEFELNSNMQKIKVKKRATLKPIVMRYNGKGYKDVVKIPAGKQSLIIFDLKVFGGGVYKEPKISFTTNNSFDKFDAWMWSKHDTGLMLPENLLEDNIKLGKTYQFKNSISEEKYGTYVLQIDRISQGTFQMCITDGIKEQCRKVTAS